MYLSVVMLLTVARLSSVATSCDFDSKNRQCYSKDSLDSCMTSIAAYKIIITALVLHTSPLNLEPEWGVVVCKTRTADQSCLML